MRLCGLVAIHVLNNSSSHCLQRHMISKVSAGNASILAFPDVSAYYLIEPVHSNLSRGWEE